MGRSEKGVDTEFRTDYTNLVVRNREHGGESELRIVVRPHRTQAGMSLMQLSKIAGVGKGTLADIENGKQLPNAKTVCKLAKALKVSVNDILVCEDEVDGKAHDNEGSGGLPGDEV